MDYVSMVLNYVKQHPVQTLVDLIALDNAILAGAKAAGFTKLEMFCGKIGQFTNAALYSFLNRNGGSNEQKNSNVNPVDPGSTDSKS